MKYNSLTFCCAAIPAMLLFLSISCQNEKEVYKEKNVGIIRDANVLTTSFNERIKTQIKTDSMFIVVSGTPSLKIGQELVCRLNDKKEIVEVQDANGNWYDVHR